MNNICKKCGRPAKKGWGWCYPHMNKKMKSEFHRAQKTKHIKGRCWICGKPAMKGVTIKGHTYCRPHMPGDPFSEVAEERKKAKLLRKWNNPIPVKHEKILCKSTRKDGKPCQSYAMIGSDYCKVHQKR